MDLDVVFLGTSGSGPTARRAPSATLVRRGGERVLVDCAEGTQRQLMQSSIGLIELREIFLTHFHADHYLGLPGMLKTWSLHGRTEPLSVYGPRGLRRFLGSDAGLLGVGRLTFELELVELDPGSVLKRLDHALVVFEVAHRAAAIGVSLVEAPRPGRFDPDAATALGIPVGPERGALQRGEEVTLADGRVVRPDEVLGPSRPGRKIVLAGDTAPSESVVRSARGADLLVHEATFSEEERDRAEETWHSTAAGAAEVAREAEVGLLALTHLSPRYFGPELKREARAIFPDTVVPRDFDVIEVPFAERGRPRLHKGGALRVPPGGRIIAAEMARMVQVAVAGDTAEAEELQEILRAAGIESEIGAGVDDPLVVQVPEDSVEAAQDAIEAMTEPDELISEP